jgi:hypothetical protein
LDGTARIDAFLVIARRYVDEIRGWSGVRLGDPAGRVLVDTSESLEDVMKSGERDSLPLGVREGRAVVSGVLPPGPVPVGRQRVIIVSVPVMREGRVVYVLSASITTARLSELVSGARQKEGWRPFLVDNEGRVVAAPSVPQAVGFLILPAGREARDAASSGTYSSKTPLGEETVTTFARSATYGWSAHVGIPVSIYAAPTFQLRLVLIGAALVTAALTAVGVAGAADAGVAGAAGSEAAAAAVGRSSSKSCSTRGVGKAARSLRALSRASARSASRSVA